MSTILFFLFLFSSLQSFAQDVHVAKDFTAEHLFTDNCEGPNYDPKRGLLYVVNFQTDGTIGQIDVAGNVSLYVTLPQGSIANAIQFDKKKNMYLADFGNHNVLKVDAKTKQISVYVHTPQFNQPNDLCINKKGQIFATDPNWKNETGQLWRIDLDGQPTLLEKNMGTCNGIDLSPDERTLYVNESVQRTIWKYRVDEQGNIIDKQKFYSFPDYGLDGMKCDAAGNLLLTRWGKGTVVILSPQGTLLKEILMKGKATTNICFGGSDGKTCFVTLSDRGCVETFRHNFRGRKK